MWLKREKKKTTCNQPVNPAQGTDNVPKTLRQIDQVSALKHAPAGAAISPKIKKKTFTYYYAWMIDLNVPKTIENVHVNPYVPHLMMHCSSLTSFQDCAIGKWPIGLDETACKPAITGPLDPHCFHEELNKQRSFGVKGWGLQPGGELQQGEWRGCLHLLSRSARICVLILLYPQLHESSHVAVPLIPHLSGRGISGARRTKTCGWWNVKCR